MKEWPTLCNKYINRSASDLLSVLRAFFLAVRTSLNNVDICVSSSSNAPSKASAWVWFANALTGKIPVEICASNEDNEKVENKDNK
jgi:hypothetical protein